VEPRCPAKRNLVLDADRVDELLPMRPIICSRLSRPRTIRRLFLRPHEGEFPRLFSDISNKHPGRSKLERVAGRAAERSGTVVLLKGAGPRSWHHRTERATIRLQCAALARYPPAQATCLAGMIAGMLAQGAPAFEAASIAVWMHGEAAREAGPGLIAERSPGSLARGVSASLRRVRPSTIEMPEIYSTM